MESDECVCVYNAKRMRIKPTPSELNSPPATTASRRSAHPSLLAPLQLQRSRRVCAHYAFNVVSSPVCERICVCVRAQAVG